MLDFYPYLTKSYHLLMRRFCCTFAIANTIISLQPVKSQAFPVICMLLFPVHTVFFLFLVVTVILKFRLLRKKFVHAKHLIPIVFPPTTFERCHSQFFIRHPLTAHANEQTANYLLLVNQEHNV